ncbi:MAG: peptidylprolyl isomerase [Halobacteriaceae archaeon]
MSDDSGADLAEDDAADEAAEAAEESAEDEGGLADGDFIRIEYTARTVEDGDLVDTTDREVAEEADVETEDREFEPRTLVLGAGQLFETVEQDIIGREVGDKGSVVVPAEEAFGEYDEEELRVVSVERLPEDDRYPGAHVDIDGEHGHVQTIVGSRARVDFNHPLAGEDIEYEYEILEQVDDPIEQARGMFQSYFDVELDMRLETEEVEEEVTVEPDEDADEDAEPTTETQTKEVETLYIESDPQLQFNQQWMFSKQQVAQDVIERLGIDRVVIEEVIEPQPSPMGGMGGMMGGGAGGEGVDLGDLEEAIEESDADAEELVEDLDIDDEAVEHPDDE